MTESFRCEACGGEFKKGWSEEEAQAERRRNRFDQVDCAVVCDDCYKQIMEYAEREGLQP